MKIESIDTLINSNFIEDGLLESNQNELFKAYKFYPKSIGEMGPEESIALKDISNKFHEALCSFEDKHKVQIIFQRSKTSSEPYMLKTQIYVYEKTKKRSNEKAPFCEHLKELGFELNPMDKKAYRKLLSNYFSVEESKKKLPDLGWEKDHLLIDRKKASVINLTELPTKTWGLCLHRLFSMSEEFTLSMHIASPERSKTKKDISTKRRISHVLSFHNNAELKNIESESTLGSSEEQLERITTGGESLFEISLGIICKNKNLKNLREQCEKITRSASNISEMGLYSEGLGVLEAFKSHLPLGKTMSVRNYPILSRNLSHLLPLCLDFYREEEDSFGPEVCSKNLEKTTLNLFSKRNLNFNGFICGSSGSGKSFLMNSIIDSFLSDYESSRVLIFDVGGSYTKLIPALGGRSIDLDQALAKNLILDFLSTQSFSPSGFCKTVLENFCGAGEHITHSHRMAIESALIDLKGKHFLISKIHKYFDQKSDQISKDLALWLRPYISWEKIETDLDSTLLSNNRLSFDFKNLDGDPLLQRLSILCLTQKLWQDLSSAKNASKTLIIFDEVWRFFSHSKSFLEELYRTLRKYGAGIVSITQNISDYGDSNFAKTVLSNSYTRLILQGGASSKLLSDLLDLTDCERKKAVGVSSKKGQFSEFFMHNPRVRQTMRLYPTKRLYELANTENIQSINSEATKTLEKHDEKEESQKKGKSI